MKYFFLISLFALAFNAVADEELPVIEDETEERVLTASVGPAAEDTVLESAPINVDGYVKKEEAPADPELLNIRSEIDRQKKEIVLNKAKAQKFKELGRSTEQLSEITEEMLLERRQAQEEIANYNLKVKCLSAQNPGAECDKFLRKRR